uniref:Uncharacterized protein n=1 Tax=Aegilops tauschii subsp. strangulata TaxID=200361 RepID=A0A452ZRU6_AEGTS
MGHTRANSNPFSCKAPSCSVTTLCVVLEHASICLTRIAEAFASPKKLDQLCNMDSGSALAAKTPLLHGISGTLKDILSGSGLVAGTTVSPTRSADQGPSPRRGYGDLVGAVCGRATSRRRQLLLSRTPAGSALASRRRRCPS